MSTIDDVLLEAQDKMEKTVAVLRDQLAGLRTGKASPALVENVQIPYYGTMTRLREMANISTPEPRLIVIQPYDPSCLGEIEKTILGANLGVTPMNDGRVVRVPIPELNEERRQEMVKVARRTAEEARVAIRHERREANDAAKALEREGTITEDDRDTALQDIQQATDKTIAIIDTLLKEKETEIMDV